MSGWIKLSREINNHWIFENSDYFKWWIDILLEVNHTPAKSIIKGKVYDCGRGEKLYSLETWAKRWKTNKSKVRRYFDLLQKENMIELKNETQTTRLKVCKYEDYQESENKSETQTKRKRNKSETQTTPIQEGNNENNENNEKNKTYRSFDHLFISLEDFEKLKEKYDEKTINDVLDDIQNYSKNKQYKSLYLTAKAWLKRNEDKKPQTKKTFNYNDVRSKTS